MLAQNFKTPTELHLTDIEFESLVKVLGMLERGELAHEPLCQRSGFTMSTYRVKPRDGCGTIGCIAGWAHHISSGQAFPWITDYHEAPDALADLFVPALPLNRITPSQAAIALRNFLTSGEPRWDEAMAES